MHWKPETTKQQTSSVVAIKIYEPPEKGSGKNWLFQFKLMVSG